MKHSRDTDENCYPFIYEAGALCDFEVFTDELCGHLGAALSLLEDPGCQDIVDDLAAIQPLAFHANGSVRGRVAIDEADIDWLKARLQYWRNQPGGQAGGFVLPRGAQPVPALHLGRSACKKAIRALVQVEQQGITVPMAVPRWLNVLCNVLFVLTLVINHRRGRLEVGFVSRSYGRPADE